MEFENYSRRINSVNEIESFGQTINEKHSQFQFSVKKMKWCLNKLKNTNLHKKMTKDTILVTEYFCCQFHIHSYTRLINSKNIKLEN